MAWACDKLDQFLRGLSFTVETDHKPLVRLMGIKDLDQVPARVLRMRLRLMRYAPTVKYVQGSHNHIADALSRAPAEEPSSVDTLFIQEVESVTATVLSEDPLILEMRNAQQLDPICREVLSLIRKGWPTYKSDATMAIHPYWDVKGHLTEVDGVVVYDQRVVVPMDLRLRTLERIHQAHQGIVKCQARARRAVWWPGISSQIKEMVQNCHTCRINTPAPVEPLCPSSFPDRPWSRVGADLFEFRKRTYLLVVNYYSHFIEVKRLESMGSIATIGKLKAVFAVHGTPDVVISDNGPQFSSREFREFAKSYEFQHVTSSPRYPRSNGEAERAVGTVKRMWEKTKDPYLSLMTYRATPLENGFTPSELLMGRLIRTTLPIMPEQRFIQHSKDSLVDKETSINLRTKLNHDVRHRAHQCLELKPGCPVYVRDMCQEGCVIGQSVPRSYKVKTNKGVIRRNRSALGDVREEGPVVSTPKAPLPVPRSAEVLQRANSCGALAPDSPGAEGLGSHLTPSIASQPWSGRLCALPRKRKRPKRLEDYMVPDILK